MYAFAGTSPRDRDRFFLHFPYGSYIWWMTITCFTCMYLIKYHAPLISMYARRYLFLSRGALLVNAAVTLHIYVAIYSAWLEARLSFVG